MIIQTLALLGLTLSLSANAAVIEVGDLNIIDDAGNASNGLRFLDMSYSYGLTELAALANAQGAYANARLATPSEFDDLYAAAGIGYDGALTAADAFEVGGGAVLSTDPNYDAGTLAAQLGPNALGTITAMWTDPDGSTDHTSTRDLLTLDVTNAQAPQANFIPPNGYAGYLLVTPVPAPAAGWLFMSALLGLVGKKRLSR